MSYYSRLAWTGRYRGEIYRLVYAKKLPDCKETCVALEYSKTDAMGGASWRPIPFSEQRRKIKILEHILCELAAGDPDTVTQFTDRLYEEPSEDLIIDPNRER